MKFFIVTCLKEYRDDVSKLFKQAEIKVFSAIDVIGFKDSDAKSSLLDWFAVGEEKFDSLMLFSFTKDEIAMKGMELIEKYNKDTATSFPVRAFIVPVEAASS